MKNYIKYTSLFLMIIGMSIVSLNTVSATTAAGTYTLQKGAQNSTSLDPGQYVMVIKSTNLYAVPAFAGSGARNIQCSDYQIDSYVTGSYYQRDEVCTLNLDGTEGITEWTITENLGSYKFFDGTYYICGQSSNSNKLLASTSSATAAEWSITHTGSLTYTAATVRNEDDVTYEYCRGNGTILSGYTSSGQGIYFFKKTATLYDINKEPDASGTASMDTKVGGVSVTKAAEDATVVLSQTAKPNYRFDEWYVIDEDSHVITVTNNQFTMPAADVWVYPHYTACGTDATVTAASSADVSQTTATVRCASGISSKGDSWCAITEYGFVISAKATNATPTIDGTGVTKHQIGTSYTTLNTAFSKALTGLTASTTYCVRAYAINGHGTAYSAVHEFTTTAETQYGNYVITCDDYHTVTYNQNTEDSYTGILPTDPNTYAAGATVYMSDGTIGRTGYDFVGWNTNPAATTAITEFVMGSSNTIVYAIWSPIDYTLTMATSVGGGAGTTISDAAITSPRTGAGTVTGKHYGEEITVTISAPAHHTFTGWTSSNGGTFANASATSTTFTMPAGNTTVTANFTEDTKYTVTWSDNGDTNTEQVYSGETTTFPALSSDCELYVAAGWVQDNSNTFTSETMTAPGTIYAVDATTPTVSANVTYKAVYRHKYYTTDEFVLNTTTSGGYYLSANPGTRRYSAAKDGSKLGTTTSLASAIPVYLEKEETGKYSFKTVGVSGEQYLAGSSGGDFSWKDSKTGDYKWSVAAGEQGKGDWHILNAGTNNTRAIIYNNNSGNYIGNYLGTNVTSSGTTYYDIDLIPAYYYMYSPDAACYDITISTNGWDRATWETLDGSHKLQGNQLTVTPACGYHITSVSITNGTFTPSSGYTTHDPVTFTIIPSGNCTFTVNFNKTPSDDDKYTISYLDGSSVMAQTKTAAVKACGTVTLPNGYNSASGAGGTCTGWTFDGWTQTEYTFGQLSEPTGIQAANSEQTVSGDQTWYAVYHKTFAAGDYFYLKYGANYVTSFNSSAHKFVAGSTESTNALLFAMESNYLYYLDPSTRNKMWVYADGNTVDVTATETKPSSTAYQTTMTLVNGTYQITNGNNRYLSANGTDVKYYSGTSYTYATKPNASSFTAYYPKTDCAIELVRITFNPGAGNTCALEYIDAEQGSTISLPVAADVSGYDADWTFIGWTDHDVTNIATAQPDPFYAGGANYVAAATTTLYAVYNQTPPDGNFDNTKGGKYKIWAIRNGIYYYATSNGEERKGKLGATTDCSEGALFELTRNAETGGYKIRVNGETKYLKGGGQGDTDFDYVQSASAPEWTITDVHSTSPNGYWRIYSGIENRAFVFGHTNFGHYDATQIANSPSMWFDVYLGQCDDNYYTSNPNKSLSLSGDIRVTSTSGETVRAHNTITVKGNLLTGNSITVESSNAKFTAVPASTTIIDGAINTTIAIDYTPTGYDATESAVITVTATDKSQQIEVYGRSLPENFVIAAKMGGKWYALPNTCTASGTQPGLAIEVDDANAPTEASLAPHDVEFGLSDIVNTRWPDYKDRVWLFEQKTGNKQALKDNANANIQVNAQVSNISAGNSAEYEWLPETSDFNAYTLTNTNSSKALSIKTDGTFGTHTQLIASNEIYLLPITAYYTLVDASVMEWGTDHLVVSMATPPATATKLKVKVGATLGSEQTLASTKKDEGIYRLATSLSSSDALKDLTLLFYNGSDVEVGRTILTVPLLVSATDATTEGFSAAVKSGSATCDIIVLNGAKLTVSEEEASKVTYRDLYIYGGGKMVVPTDKYIGFSSVIMRGGHLNSSWQYQYSHPQLVLNGNMSNSVGKIYYDYLTNNAQFYSLAVPYNVTLTDIVNPYFNNKRSWIVHSYDGKLRASGSQVDGWYDIEEGSKINEEVSVAALTSTDHITAGWGYTFFGAPQKVNSIRQKWSVNRFRMTVAGNAAETTKPAVTVTAYGMTEDSENPGTYVLNEGVAPNDAGWNILGNPFLADINGTAALESGEMIQAKISSYHNQKVLDDNNQWTGAWERVENTSNVRYVRIPSDNGEEYSQTRFSAATLRAFHHFFIQAGATGDFQLAVSNRVQSVPVRRQTNGIVLPDEMDVDLLLKQGNSSTPFGLTVNDEFSTTFRVGEDMPEDLAGTTMKAYTLIGTDARMTYNGLPYQAAEELIPVGYRAQVEGEYTFEYVENQYDQYLEHVWLTDYQAPQKTVDLMFESYKFTTESGVFDNRFALNVVFKKEGIASDIEETTGSEIDSGPQKFIYLDKLFIRYNGIIYDATGKKVNEIK